jgi:RimJ/RimL family protein N-acetyltransferase
MRSEPVAITFRPVTQGDLALLDGWLNAPHMRQWWGEPETELGYIRDMIEGRDTTRPFIIVSDGRDVGYIQYWFIGDHQNKGWIDDNPWLEELPAEAVGVDLSIGAAENLSRGIGTAALVAFVAMLRAEGHETIVIDPDASNARAVRAYEKAGFRPIEHLRGRTQDVLLMQHEQDQTGPRP